MLIRYSNASSKISTLTSTVPDGSARLSLVRRHRSSRLEILSKICFSALKTREGTQAACIRSTWKSRQITRDCSTRAEHLTDFKETGGRNYIFSHGQLKSLQCFLRVAEMLDAERQSEACRTIHVTTDLHFAGQDLLIHLLEQLVNVLFDLRLDGLFKFAEDLSRRGSDSQAMANEAIYLRSSPYRCVSQVHRRASVGPAL